MKKVQIVLVVTLATACSSTFAQTKLVDSLKTALAVSTEENRYDILWGLAWELYDVDNPAALNYAREAHPLAIKSGDTLRIVKSGRILGQLLRRGGKLDESIVLFERMLPISRRNEFEGETKLMLNALAVAFTHQGEYDKAITYHIQSLELREKSGDKRGISGSYQNIGLVHYKLENHELALEYYFKSLKANPDSTELSRILINIGLAYVQLKDYQNATKYIRLGFESCLPDCDQITIMNGEFGLGDTFYDQEMLPMAEVHFTKSLDIAVSLSNQEFEIECLLMLSKIAIKRNDFRKGAIYMRRIEQVPDKNQYKRLLVDLFQLKATIAANEGNFVEAFRYQLKYSELRESILEVEMNKNVMRMQVMLNAKENVARIESQSRIMALQKVALNRQQSLNVLTAIVALLTIILAAVLFYSNRQKKRVNERLDLRVRERTAELEEGRDLLQHSYNKQEIVLGRVVSEVTSALGTLKGLVTIATSDLPEEKARYFRELEATIGQLSANVKRAIQR